MPKSAPRPCVACRVLVLDGTSRCALHQRREGTFSDTHRGSRHERGYGTEWDKARKRIMERDAGLCQECRRQGYVTRAYAVDHIVCKAEGGADDDGNLEAICKPHHVRKTAEENQRARRRAGV